MLTFKDRKNDHVPFDWEITMSASDLEALIRYVGEDIINRQL